MSERKWLCPSCHHFAATRLLRVLTHIRQVHAFEADFHVTCGIDGCPKTYDNFHSYRKHLYNQHNDKLHPTSTHPDQEHADQQHADQEQEGLETEPSTNTTVDSSTRQSALLLLKTTTVHKVSKTSG